MSPQDYSSAAASIFTFRRVFAPAGLLAGLLFSAQAFAQQQEPPTVTAAKPVVRDIVEDDEFVGRFEAVDQVAIRSRVSGYLDRDPFQGRRDRQEGRPALHHRPAPLPGRLRRSQVAGRCRDEPARLQQDAAASAPRSSPTAATSRPLRSTTAGANILLPQARLPGRDRRAQDRQPRPRIHRDQGAARRPHRPPAGLGRQSRAARPDAAHHDRGARPDRLLFRRRRAPLPRLCARRAHSAAAACRKAPAASTSSSASPTARALPSRASSTSPRTASTTRPARCGCAPASTIPTASCSPACSAASTCRARCPIKGMLVPDEAIGADQDRRIVYVVDDDGQCHRPSRSAPARASTATASSARA